MENLQKQIGEWVNSDGFFQSLVSCILREPNPEKRFKMQLQIAALVIPGLKTVDIPSSSFRDINIVYEEDKTPSTSVTSDEVKSEI